MHHPEVTQDTSSYLKLNFIVLWVWKKIENRPRGYGSLFFYSWASSRRTLSGIQSLLDPSLLWEAALQFGPTEVSQQQTKALAKLLPIPPSASIVRRQTVDMLLSSDIPMCMHLSTSLFTSRQNHLLLQSTSSYLLPRTLKDQLCSFSLWSTLNSFSKKGNSCCCCETCPPSVRKMQKLEQASFFLPSSTSVWLSN